MKQTNRRQPNASGSITKTLFQKAMVTMLVAELSGAVAAVIDAILSGSFLGGTALAASGLGGPYFSIASIVSGILMVGCTNLCTRAIGKGDMKELNGVFSLTVGLGVLCSVLLGAGGAVFAGAFAKLFGAGKASPEVYAETVNYLRGVFIGAPGFIMFVILTPILQLDGDSARPKIASIVCSVVDVAGDLLNIFVFHGGMLGMGLATSVSHYAALAVMLSHFLKKGSMFRFSPERLRPGGIPALLRDGVSRAVCMLCRGLLPILLNSLILRLAGDMGVTALSAMTGTTFVLGALGWGIGGAVLIMGGMMVGEQNLSGLKTVVNTALRDIIFFVVCFAAVIALAAPLIAALFIPEPGELRQMATAAIRCYAICLPFLALNVSAANYFQSISRSLGANLVNIGIEVAFPAAVAWLLSAFLGVRGVWMAFPVGQALLSCVVVARFLLARDPARTGVEAHLQLKPGFGVPPEDCIERSVQQMDEVIALCNEAYDFCVGHGFDKKTANRLSLCIEEMAGNVVEHGFSDGKPHHLDLRVLEKDGQLTLRMRDDCTLFDLKEKAANWAPDPEHPEKNIGIRLVLAAAKDIVYSGAMNTNNLIITV